MKNLDPLKTPAVHFILINLLSVISGYITLVGLDEYNVSYLKYSALYTTINIPLFLSLYKIKKEKKEIKFFSIPTIYLKLFTYSFLIIIILFILNLNMSLLIKNGEYLKLINPKDMNLENIFFRIYLKAMPLISAVAALLLPSLKLKKAIHIYVFLIFIIAFGFIYQLANNSRSTIIIIFSSISGLLLFSKKGLLLYIKVTALVLLALITYITVLVGRSSLYQGISQIPRNLSKAVSITSSETELSYYSSFSFQNLFEGSYIFYQGAEIPTTYPFEYKLLSFSPLTSSLDNFDKYLKHTHFINPTVPYGSFLEVYHFGINYIAFYFLILFFSLRTLNKLVLQSPLLGYLVASPAYLFFIANQQYPLRNYLRFLLISAFLSICIMIYLRQKK